MLKEEYHKPSVPITQIQQFSRQTAGPLTYCFAFIAVLCVPGGPGTDATRLPFAKKCVLQSPHPSSQWPGEDRAPAQDTRLDSRWFRSAPRCVCAAPHRVLSW